MNPGRSAGDDDLRLHLTLDVSAEEYIPRVLECVTDDEASIHSMWTTDAGRQRLVQVDVGILTEMQRRTLEMAYEAGYYETPRRTDLGELSEELGVSRSAVSQRLNTAEAKLVSAVLDGRSP